MGVDLSPELALAVQHWAQCAAALSRATELLQRQMAASGIDSPGRFAERRGALGDAIRQAIEVPVIEENCIYDSESVSPIESCIKQGSEYITMQLLRKLESELFPSGVKVSEQSTMPSDKCLYYCGRMADVNNLLPKESNLRRKHSSRCHINDIPDDILSDDILGFLCYQRLPLRCVSKRWNAAVLNAIGWHGSLRLRRHCPLPPDGYNGDIELDMSSRCFDHTTAKEIIQHLEEYKNVKTLHLDSALLDDDGVRLVFEALTKKPYEFTNLSLNFNKLSVYDTKFMPEMLRVQANIKALYLHHTSMGDETVAALCDALLYNNTIESLDVGQNAFDYNGIVSFSNFLQRNSSLTSLELGFNAIGDRGVECLVEGLGTNKTLHILDLECNEITALGASLLSVLLMVNNSITSLDLESNTIGDNGAIVLCSMLQVNSTLINLNVAYNNIQEAGRDAFIAVLDVNNGFHVLNFDRNMLPVAHHVEFPI